MSKKIRLLITEFQEQKNVAINKIALHNFETKVINYA